MEDSYRLGIENMQSEMNCQVSKEKEEIAYKKEVHTIFHNSRRIFLVARAVSILLRKYQQYNFSRNVQNRGNLASAVNAK